MIIRDTKRPNNFLRCGLCILNILSFFWYPFDSILVSFKQVCAPLIYFISFLVVPVSWRRQRTSWIYNTRLFNSMSEMGYGNDSKYMICLWYIISLLLIRFQSKRNASKDYFESYNIRCSVTILIQRLYIPLLLK